MFFCEQVIRERDENWEEMSLLYSCVPQCGKVSSRLLKDLSRDGIHLNRKGVYRLSMLFQDVIYTVLRSLDAIDLSTQDKAISGFSFLPENEDEVSSPVPRVSPSSPHPSGNCLPPLGGSKNHLRVAHLNVRSLNTGFDELSALGLTLSWIYLV
ncbi:hypothetical protein J6590_066113 [Homalodisca vitripennis]|nr:hypothetical protein J6590_066113 [Homalodisca vitripennis]